MAAMNQVPDKRLAALLAALPGTQSEVADAMQVTGATVGQWMRLLCESGHAHIGGWQKNKRQGPPVRVYHAGPGQDVPCDVETGCRNGRTALAVFVGGRPARICEPRRRDIAY